MNLLFHVLLILQIGFAPNPFWVRLDKKLIKGITQTEKSSPDSLEAFFLKKNKREIIDLGFGWSVWETTRRGGYISIYADFYYFHDEIIAYRIIPELPDEESLKKKYKNWYSPYFEFEGKDILPLEFQERIIKEPLKYYYENNDSLEVNNEVKYYMSPRSGLRYGYSGGISGNLLLNRKLFKGIKGILNNKEVILLMHSVNPASRLTAIEFYLQNKENFSENFEIEQWIEKIYLETPTIETLSGCMVEIQNSRKLVEMYANMKQE